MLIYVAGYTVFGKEHLGRSTMLAAALVGMGRPEHVLENLGVALVAPATREQYLRLYQ